MGFFMVAAAAAVDSHRERVRYETCAHPEDVTQQQITIITRTVIASVRIFAEFLFYIKTKLHDGVVFQREQMARIVLVLVSTQLLSTYSVTTH